MTEIVMCHGIGYQRKHRADITTDWYARLRANMHDCGLPVPEPAQVTAIAYANCYRSIRTKGADRSEEGDEFAALDPLDLEDMREGFELDLLLAIVEGLEPDPSRGTKGVLGSLLLRLESSRELGRPSAKLILRLIRQVGDYLAEDGSVRACVLRRFDRIVTPQTRVIIGHSLGSIVAYEALCTRPDWNVHTLITLGSPLGFSAVRERLRPRPYYSGTMPWPGVSSWINVAAKEDPIALVKELGTVFDDRIQDYPVTNAGLSRIVLGGHSVMRYLTTEAVADGVADALR